MSLLLLLGGASAATPPTFVQTNYNAITKEVESSAGIGLMLGSTASGNSFIFGGYVTVVPTGTPTPSDRPIGVILDTGVLGGQQLYIWMPALAGWIRFVPG